MEVVTGAIKFFLFSMIFLSGFCKLTPKVSATPRRHTLYCPCLLYCLYVERMSRSFGGTKADNAMVLYLCGVLILAAASELCGMFGLGGWSTPGVQIVAIQDVVAGGTWQM